MKKLVEYIKKMPRYDFYDDENIEEYSEEELKEIYCGAFGEVNGKLLVKCVARIFEIKNVEGLNNSNRAEYEELLEKYNQLLDSFGGKDKLLQYALEKKMEDNENKRDYIKYMSRYDEEDLRQIYGNIFGRKNAKFLAKYMTRIAEIKYNEKLNDKNRDEYEELLEKYNQLLDSLGGEKKLIDYLKNTMVVDYIDEDYEDEAEYMEYMAKYSENELRQIYSNVFGKTNGNILSKYMARIFEIKYYEDLNYENRDEYEEILEKYNELLNSLGGEEELIDYLKNTYGFDENNDDEYDYDEYDDDEE